MKNLPLDRDTILKRINGIQLEAEELRKLGELLFEEYKNGTGHKLAEYHLHRALEGVFNICAHILSRIPGGAADQYKEMATKFGEFGLIDKDFASTKLKEMAKYRNRVVHFYSEVTPEETYSIIHNDLGDFDIFLSAVKEILQNPDKYNLEIE